MLQQRQEIAHLCHQWMIDHVPGYTAKIWDEPRKRKSDGKYFIYIDHRVFDALTPAISINITEINTLDTWEPLKL